MSMQPNLKKTQPNRFSRRAHELFEQLSRNCTLTLIFSWPGSFPQVFLAAITDLC